MKIKSEIIEWWKNLKDLRLYKINAPTVTLKAKDQKTQSSIILWKFQKSRIESIKRLVRICKIFYSMLAKYQKKNCINLSSYIDRKITIILFFIKRLKKI